MVDVAEKMVEGFDDECLLGRWQVAELRETGAFGRVRHAATLIGVVTISTTRAGARAITDRVAAGGARSAAMLGALGWAVDTVEPVGATSVAFWHGAAAFCLPGVAGLAGLANTTAWRMSSDDVDVQGICGGGPERIHTLSGGGAEDVLRDGIVVGAGEAKARTVLTNIAGAITAHLSSATGHAGV